MRKSFKGYTLFEVLTVIGTVLLLSGLILFVAGPAVKEASSARVCASNLKQIAVAERLYMSNNDGGEAPWKAPQMRPYLKESPVSLYCPKANTYLGSTRMSPYRDLIALHLAYVNSYPRSIRAKLPNGLVAPDFDIEQDAILKCLEHGSQGYIEPTSSNMLGLIEPNVRGKVLSLYLDGHVTPAHPVACWELPDMANELIYRQHPELLQLCDGKLASVH